MKKTLNVCAAILLGLIAIFALNVIGNVVFTHIALSGETSPDFQEELASGSSISEIVGHSIEASANDIREAYGEYGDGVPAGTIWKQSFVRTVRNMHITDYFEPDYEPQETEWYSAWKETEQELEAADRERRLALHQDTWNTINRTINRELAEGLKRQYIEVISAGDGSLLQVLEDESEIAALMDTMRTDDWEVVSPPEGLTPQYELVVYQQVNWPTGDKIQEVGRYTIYEGGAYAGFHITLMPIGVSEINLKIPAAVAEVLRDAY